MRDLLHHPLTFRLAALATIVLVITATFQAITPSYLSMSNFTAILRAMALNGVVALGLTFVIVLRKFDLSLAGVASLSAMTLGFAIQETNSLAFSMMACMAIGMVAGAVNGLLVGKFRLPDVVSTIAIGSICAGLAWIYNDGATFSQNFFSSGMVLFNTNRFFGIQMPVVVLIITAILTFLILHTTRFGNAFYASGENETATRYSGISVAGVSLVGFAICGALTALAMVLHVSGIGSARVTAGGQIMLPAYTSVYLGAALLSRPSVPATLVGAFLMTLLLNGFTLMSVPYYYSDAVVSLILIVAIVMFDPRILKVLRRPQTLLFKQSRAT